MQLETYSIGIKYGKYEVYTDFVCKNVATKVEVPIRLRFSITYVIIFCLKYYLDAITAVVV